jgi:hypothetical protein
LADLEYIDLLGGNAHVVQLQHVPPRLRYLATSNAALFPGLRSSGRPDGQTLTHLRELTLRTSVFSETQGSIL